MLRASMVVSLAVLSDALRAPLIAGNWKCNPATVDDAVALATALHAAAPEREVVVFPPSPYLEPVAHAADAVVEPAHAQPPLRVGVARQQVARLLQHGQAHQRLGAAEIHAAFFQGVFIVKGNRR